MNFTRDILKRVDTGAVIDFLADEIKEVETDYRPYQTDLYLHFDPEDTECPVWIERFANVGGNSWIENRYHYLNVVYVSVPKFDRPEDVIFDGCNTADDIAEAINMRVEDLIEDIIFSDIKEDEDEIDNADIIEFISKKYPERVMEAFKKFCFDNVDWVEIAKETFENFCDTISYMDEVHENNPFIDF